MLELVFSNRYEALEAALLDDLATAPDNPFEPQYLVLPSLAMRRRIDLAHAQRFGVSANLRCEFLAQWLWAQIGRFVSVPHTSPFAPDVLQWRIFRLFAEDHSLAADSGRLGAYLQRADDSMRLELAQRVAGLFDQYLTYRPEWLEAWSEGREADPGSTAPEALDDARWQAKLWRAITLELGLNPFHPAGDFFRAAERVATDDPRIASLPRRASVFCLPTMPSLYIRLLELLGRWMPIRIYLLNPCREYWFEAIDAKRLSYLSLQGRGELHEIGNPLLASWGRQTQAQIDLLLGETGAETQLDDSLFQPNERPTLLAAMQNAILDMTPLQSRLDAADRSLEFHCCHSLLRQLEVLHDQLLDLFGQPDAPTPEDVLVVTPKLAEAAPLIDAVFSAMPVDRRIPYAVTGRPATQGNAVARILLALFELPQSRFAASRIFELLLEPPVAARFDLAAAELDTVQTWIAGSGVRWGIDARHRGECGLPPSPRHTFTEGMQRLFLGYAMPDEEHQLVGGVLPHPAAEGAEARILGQLWLYLDRLRRFRERLGESRTPDQWRAFLDELLEAFVLPDEESREQLRELQDAIAAVTENIALGAGAIAVSLDALSRALTDALDDPTRGGVPSGRVTFAAMPSLRALPYRVVCFLGMDDGAFPSPVSRNEFDLMALTPPRRGDRQRQLDERNLFLDLLLAARERVIITYTGRNIRDNAPLPPSVLVAELLDHLAAATAADPGSPASIEQARRGLILEHPLQPFSPRYFRHTEAGSRLFSFDADYCAAARRKLAPEPAAAASSGRDETDDGEDIDDSALLPPFLPERLPPAPVDQYGRVTLEQLGRFFRNPCHYLLRERLGIRLQEARGELCDEEPFALDWEGWHSLTERLLPLLLHGLPGTRVEELAAAGSEFPEGEPGALLLDRELARLTDFADRVSVALTPTGLEPLSFRQDFPIGGETWTLTGTLVHLGPDGQVRYRCDKARESDYLATWLSHLALCTAAPAGIAAITRGIALDGEFTFRPVDGAAEHLAELLQLYREGLSRPLHFFLRSAFAYLKDEDLRKAYAVWQSQPSRPYGEDRNPWHRLALRGETDPLRGEFADLARRILGPLLAHLEEPIT